MTFAAAHLTAARRDRAEDWWALAWLRGTEVATDALWARSPGFAGDRRARASLTDWYVKTTFPGLLYQTREGLSVLAEAPNAGKSFENGVIRWRSSERFGGRPLNWRGFILVS